MSNHAGNDYGVMDYDNDWINGIAEFSVFGVLTGSSDTARDSLRDREDD